MAPQREVLNRISRGDLALIGEDARIFYRDIYNHIVRIKDLNQTIRDMAAIFLPLGIVTGIFEMNFIDNKLQLGHI